MADDVCGYSCCWRGRADGMPVCARHVEQLRVDFAWLDAHMDDLEHYRINRAYGAAHGTPGKGDAAPAPLREALAVALWQVDAEGRPGLRVVLWEWGRAMALNVSSANSCGYLLGRVSTCARLWECRATPVYMELLHDVTRRLRRLLGSDGGNVVMGPCPTPGCGSQLSMPKHAAEVVCHHCHARWDPAWLRRHQLADVAASDVTATPQRLSELLAMGGVRTPASTIRSWARRGRLGQAGEDAHSRPVYRLADAIALATGQTTATTGDTKEEHQ